MQEQECPEERVQHARKLAALTDPVCQWRDQHLCRQCGSDRELLTSDTERDRSIVARQSIRRLEQLGYKVTLEAPIQVA